MKRLLVMRFSAFGDVAMTVPVIHSLATSYPDIRITVVSRKPWAALFAKLPENVEFIGVDLKKDYKGLKGILRLYKRLAALDFDAVADLHSVLRTHILTTLFRLKGVKVACINKGRCEKKRLVKNPRKYIDKAIPSSFERYHSVFRHLGLNFKLQFTSIYGDSKGDMNLLPSTLLKRLHSPILVGIAPFAAHEGKIYPLSNMQEVVRTLSTYPDVQVVLFGGTSFVENDTFGVWENTYPGVVCVAGQLTLEQELILMSNLCTMISMDSANMHLASLVGTRVVSIWGATHPSAGFLGWGQSSQDVVQLPLACRPCSIYGNKPCKRGDFGCMNLNYEYVLHKVYDTFPTRHLQQ